MIRLKFFSFLLTLFFLTGCTIHQKVLYSLNDVSASIGSPFLQSSLTIKEFEDLREIRKEEGSFNQPAMVELEGETWFYNGDDRYEKGTVGPMVTEMVAEHLRKTKLFENVFLNSDDAPKSDFLLEGKLKKIEAFRQYSTGATLASGFGLIGALATVGLESEYKGTTIIAPVKLIDLSSNTVLWQGEIKGEISGEDWADPYGWSVYNYASLSLKKAVEELILALKSARP